MLRAAGWTWIVISSFAVTCLELISVDPPLVGMAMVAVLAISPGLALIGLARLLNRRDP
jgi:hypothetical protein